MQQSNVIFGMLLIAFIVFITVRGELPAYISLLRGGAAAGGGSDIAASTNSVVAGAETLFNSNGPINTPSMSPMQANQLLDLFGQP